MPNRKQDYVIKATKIPHAYTRERPAPTGQRTRGEVLAGPSMDCRQGTHKSCIWDKCACPQRCHAAQVHENGRWRDS